MKPLEKMSFSQNAQQIISYVFYILFAGFSIYKIIQVEFLSTKILFIILLVIILAVALYSEYLKHLYRKAIKTIAYDLNPERANEQFNELLKKELSNSLKYKYLSMFILYEDFISMLLKEYNIYKIGITIDSAIKLLKDIDITYRHDVESIIYAFANKFSISGVLQIFALTAKTSAPNSFNSLMVSWNLSSSGSSISARTTLNPFCAYLTAWARPCPIAPPVINTVFFCSLMTFFPFHFFKWFKCICYFFNLLICHYYNN